MGLEPTASALGVPRATIAPHRHQHEMAKNRNIIVKVGDPLASGEHFFKPHAPSIGTTLEPTASALGVPRATIAPHRHRHRMKHPFVGKFAM